jgi:mono/diheme cytochrome c family protein
MAYKLSDPQHEEEHAMTSFNANVAVLGGVLAILALYPFGATGKEPKNTEKAAVTNTSSAAGEREVIPGADGMTSAERDVYRRRMAAATSAEDKARIRAEYTKAQNPPAFASPLVGDPARGANLHRGCFGCHGIERYVAPVTYAAASFIDSLLRASGLSDLPPADPARFKGRMASLAALRDGVMRRNDYLSPKMTPQEVEDVVAYLNVTYYKFPQ